ncbi:hypothetical protein TNCV_690071 [Trichonephila clavipes]|nr:hypothetical protein TNCV_690071 [Trichonephila clavipes]
MMWFVREEFLSVLSEVFRPSYVLSLPSLGSRSRRLFLWSYIWFVGGVGFPHGVKGFQGDLQENPVQYFKAVYVIARVMIISTKEVNV